MKTSDANTAGSMSASSAERRRFAHQSRKWNSTQNPKFLTEFPEEHAANLEWMRKDAEEQRRIQDAQTQESKLQEHAQLAAKNRRDSSGIRKWVMIGVIGA